MMLSSFYVFSSFIILSTFSYEYNTYEVQVKVDHFTFVDEDTFNIRVLMNDSYWEGGPIFACLGGEDPIDKTVEITGFLWEAAVKFKALIVFIEHRYYGKSLPYGEKSLTDIKYFGFLTVEQALSDYIHVLYYVDSEQWKGITKENPSTVIGHPIITFGSFYGGMIAAWSRSKYPHVVAGALASTSPILQFPGLVKCESFYQTITEVFGIDFGNCPDLIRKTWDAFYAVTSDGSNADGNKWLSDTWKLCTPITTYDDVYNLIKWVWTQFEIMALTNYPYESNVNIPLPANPVKEFCSKMTDTTEDPKDLLTSMFDGLNFVVNYTGKVECFGGEESTTNPSNVEQFNPWSLQHCMEVTMPICADGINDMFLETPWNATVESDYCYENYKVRPDFDQIKIEYGGGNLDAASNIILSNGLLDPWSKGIPKTDLSETVTTLILPNASQRLDLMASNEKDPEDVKEARKVYEGYFEKWITEFNSRK